MRAKLAALLLLLTGQEAFAFMDLYNFPKEEPKAEQPTPGGPVVMPADRFDGATLENGIPGLSHAADLLSGKMTAPETGTYQGAGIQGDDRSICIAAILDVEQRYGIPENLLLAIGLQEAGTRRDGALTIWPWTVNSHGVGKTFPNRAAAVAWVRSEHASGRPSTDVGCMQINLKWHPDAFRSADEGFDPVKNVTYAARFLTDLKREHGDWFSAAGHYHSGTASYQSTYLEGIRTNLQVAHKQRGGFEALARNATFTKFAKNGIAEHPGMGDNAGGRISSLAPGAYRRQFERVQERERILSAERRRVPEPVSESLADEPAADGAPWWSAEISNSATGGSSRSIYSRQDLEPVLPILTADTGTGPASPSSEP